MRCPPRVRVSTLRATLTLLAVCAAAACSGGDPGAGAAGTAGGPEAPFAIEISQTYITVENRTGAPLVGGEMEISQVGIRPPYRTALPRLETGAKRDILLNTFRATGGTPFNRSIARPRSVKVTAKDLAGKVYENEVPFD